MKEIRRRVKEGQMDDLVAAAVGEIGGTGSRTLRSAEWRKVDGVLYFRDHIYVPNNPEL